MYLINQSLIAHIHHIPQNIILLGENEATNNTNLTYKYPSNAFHCANLVDLKDYVKIVFDMEHKIHELEKNYLLNTSDKEKEKNFMNHEFVLYKLCE